MAKILSEAESAEYEAVRAIGAHFGWKGDARRLALHGFQESDRRDKPDFLGIAVPDEVPQGGRSEDYFATVTRYYFDVHRSVDYRNAAMSLLAGVSWAHSPVEDEAPRHREAAAVMDRHARGLLWKISDCTFMPGAEVVELIDDYDDLRGVVRVVRAGWATAGPRGLYITDRGRDVAGQLFVDR